MCDVNCWLLRRDVILTWWDPEQLAPELIASANFRGCSGRAPLLCCIELAAAEEPSLRQAGRLSGTACGPTRAYPCCQPPSAACTSVHPAGNPSRVWPSAASVHASVDAWWTNTFGISGQRRPYEPCFRAFFTVPCRWLIVRNKGKSQTTEKKYAATSASRAGGDSTGHLPLDPADIRYCAPLALAEAPRSSLSSLSMARDTHLYSYSCRWLPGRQAHTTTVFGRRRSSV